MKKILFIAFIFASFISCSDEVNQISPEELIDEVVQNRLIPKKEGGFHMEIPPNEMKNIMDKLDFIDEENRLTVYMDMLETSIKKANKGKVQKSFYKTAMAAHVLGGTAYDSGYGTVNAAVSGPSISGGGFWKEKGRVTKSGIVCNECSSHGLGVQAGGDDYYCYAHCH